MCQEYFPQGGVLVSRHHGFRLSARRRGVCGPGPRSGGMSPWADAAIEPIAGIRRRRRDSNETEPPSSVLRLVIRVENIVRPGGRSRF